jgi:hypothetical protein
MLQARTISDKMSMLLGSVLPGVHLPDTRQEAADAAG